MYSVIKMVFAFLWQIFIGKAKFKEVWREDRRKVYMFITIVILGFMNYKAVSRLIELGNVVITQRNIISQLQQYSKTTDKEVSSAIDSVVANSDVTSTPTGKVVTPPKPRKERFLDELEKIDKEVTK